jgi:hypothetical protein
MANLSKVVEDDKKTTQTITLSGRYRNALIEEAKSNGLSLSAQIALILSSHIKEKGLNL